jgi:hypothetical protein
LLYYYTNNKANINKATNDHQVNTKGHNTKHKATLAINKNVHRTSYISDRQTTKKKKAIIIKTSSNIQRSPWPPYMIRGIGRAWLLSSASSWEIATIYNKVQV